MESFEWNVTPEQKSTRIDKLITTLNQNWSRTQVQIWIKEGHLNVNNSDVKTNYKVEPGDVITLRIPDPEELEVVAENIPLDIAYEDEDVIVVNKPRGMVVHPAPGHSSGTLVNALMYHCKDGKIITEYICINKVYYFTSEQTINEISDCSSKDKG